jgi:SM-20-related protein
MQAPLILDEQWTAWIDRLAEDDYVVIDDFLPDPLYGELRAYCLELAARDEFAKAGIGAQAEHQLRSEIRGDFVHWLQAGEHPAAEQFFGLADTLMRWLNRTCYLSLSGYEFHMALYPAGSFYKKHLDQFRGRNNRLISMILYLNEDWMPGHGGELNIFRPDGSEVRVSPVARRCVLFKSAEVPHEVLPTQVPRYSLTGWFLYQPVGLGGLL